MRSQFPALLWYHWRLSRIWIATAAAVFLANTMFAINEIRARGLTDVNWRESAAFRHLATTNFLVGVFTLIGLPMVLALTLGFQNGSALPAHLQSMPISTRKWTRAYMAFNVLVLGLFACAMALVYVQLFDLEPLDRAIRMPALVCATILSAALLLLAATISRYLALFVAAPLGLLSTFLVYAASNLDALGLPVLALAIPLSFFIVRAASNLSRRNRLENTWAWLFAASALTEGRTRAFDTPERALRWYEWQYAGKYFFLLSCPFLILVCGSVGEFSLYRLDRAYGVVPVLLILAGVTGGFTTLRRYYDYRRGVEGFFFTLPVSTRRLAGARLSASVRTMGTTAGGLIGVTLLSIGTTADTLVLASPWDLPIFLLNLTVALVAAWALLWLAVPFFYSVLGLYLLTGVTDSLVRSRIFAGAWMGSPLSEIVLTRAAYSGYAPSLWIAISLLLVAAAWLAWTGWKRRYVKPITMMCLLPLWALGFAYGAYCAVGTLITPVFFSTRTSFTVLAIVLTFGLSLVPLFPLCTVPFSIDFLRHGIGPLGRKKKRGAAPPSEECD